MKTFTSICAVATLALAGCMEGQAPASGTLPGQITTKAEFLSSVANRNLTFEGYSFVINSNGTVSGPWDGSGITGTWYWDNGYWCRTVAIGGNERPEDCQRWVINGNVANVTRDRGNGASFDYIIG